MLVSPTQIHPSYTYWFFFQIALLQQYPHLKPYIKSAIEKSIQDLLLPVADRSAKIALTTAENIIKKVKYIVSIDESFWTFCGRVTLCLHALFMLI